MLFRCIRAENRKLHHSVIWLLFLGIPLISALFGTANYMTNLAILKKGWYDLWTQFTLFYALFFFAPLVGLYASYLWRLEHHGHNWNLIMSMPVRPFCLFFAKFCVVAKMALLTQLWMLALFVVCGKLGAGLHGLPPAEMTVWLLRGAIGSLAVIAVQLLLSMLIGNFALPVFLALGGSIVGMLAVNSDRGLFWPYSLMLLGMNSNRAEDVIPGELPFFFLSTAVFLALAFLAAALLLSRRDVHA